jgi:class 3 adenylate cyclase
VASAVQSEQPDLRSHAAPDGTVTVMFSDIEGSTSINERLGDERWMDVLRSHNALIRERISAYHGAEVKTAGDGFMVAFQSPLQAVRCAVAIQRAFEGHDEGHAEHPLRVRIGLHAGTPVAEAGDYYGKDVTLAARIGDAARGGEILVSSDLRRLVESAAEVAFGEPRELEMKGLLGTHAVCAVVWEGAR